MAQPNRKPLSRAIQKARTAVRLPLRFVALAAAAWVLLWFARLAVITIPLKRLVRVFGEDHGVNPSVPLVSEAQIAKARSVRRAIDLAARYSPSFANCYPQALVARLFLRARGVPHALFFGLRRNPETDAMDAHAWVMAGPLPVTGGHSFGRFTVVRSFLSGPGLS